MTTAEKFRLLEHSPIINTARFIFNSLKKKALWTTLGEQIIEIKTGKTPSKNVNRYYEDNYLSWFKPDEIGSQKYLYEAKNKISKYAVDKNQTTIYEPNTILINAIGDIGRISILKTKSSSNQQITGIRFNEKVIPEYAYYYLVSNRSYFLVDLYQTTLPIINQKKILSIPFLLPELELQENIIKGLSVIEKIQTVNDINIINLTKWSREYNSACKKFFNLHFINKSLIFEQTCQLDLLKKLKQQILQDAVQGKLVKQNPKDEPASVLLEKIKAEKERKFIANEIYFKTKIPNDENLIEKWKIPNSWYWANIGTFCDLMTGATPSTKNHLYFGGDIKWLVSGDINKKIIYDCKGRITELALKNSNCKILPINSVLIALNGQGKTRASVAILKIKAACNQSLVAIIPILNNEIFTKYIFYSLKNIYYQIRDITGQKKRRGLNMKLVYQLPIPLPPLAEQRRIVMKIEELMNKCDELEINIKQGQRYTEQLMQSVLRDALKSGE